MPLIGALLDFTALTTIRSSDVDQNFSDIRTAFNDSAVLTDVAKTISVTHVYSATQTFSGGWTGTTGSLSGTMGVGGVFALGSVTPAAAATAGAVAGDLAHPNATYTRGVTSAGTTSKRLIGLSASNVVTIDPDAAGVTVGGSLSVAGATTLAGTLGVTGATTLAALSATTGSFSSNVTVGGTHTVTGIGSFRDEVRGRDAGGNPAPLNCAGYGLATYQKAGIPTDADWSTAPPNGALVVDSANSRLYARVGGAWKYATLN